MALPAEERRCGFPPTAANAPRAASPRSAFPESRVWRRRQMAGMRRRQANSERGQASGRLGERGGSAPRTAAASSRQRQPPPPDSFVRARLLLPTPSCYCQASLSLFSPAESSLDSGFSCKRFSRQPLFTQVSCVIQARVRGSTPAGGDTVSSPRSLPNRW